MNRDLLTDELILDEGLMLKPYRCTSGALTIGVGRNLDDIGITEGEARHLLANDIARVEGELDRRFYWWRYLPDAAQRGLANMTFNLGITRLLGFKRMLLALEQAAEANRFEDYRPETRDAWLSKAADEALNSRWAEQVRERAQRIAELMRSQP